MDASRTAAVGRAVVDSMPLTQIRATRCYSSVSRGCYRVINTNPAIKKPFFHFFLVFEEPPRMPAERTCEES